MQRCVLAPKQKQQTVFLNLVPSIDPLRRRHKAQTAPSHRLRVVRDVYMCARFHCLTSAMEASAMGCFNELNEKANMSTAVKFNYSFLLFWFHLNYRYFNGVHSMSETGNTTVHRFRYGTCITCTCIIKMVTVENFLDIVLPEMLYFLCQISETIGFE